MRKSLEQIREIPGPYISASDAGAYIGIDPQIIRVAACGKSTVQLPFPTEKWTEKRLRIPKGPFIEWAEEQEGRKGT